MKGIQITHPFKLPEPPDLPYKTNLRPAMLLKMPFSETGNAWLIPSRLCVFVIVHWEMPSIEPNGQQDYKSQHPPHLGRPGPQC